MIFFKNRFNGGYEPVGRVYAAVESMFSVYDYFDSRVNIYNLNLGSSLAPRPGLTLSKFIAFRSSLLGPELAREERL